MSRCLQPVYQTLNFLDYDWQLIDGVHCLIWYSSLQLSSGTNKIQLVINLKMKRVMAMMI